MLLSIYISNVVVQLLENSKSPYKKTIFHTRLCKLKIKLSNTAKPKGMEIISNLRNMISKNKNHQQPIQRFLQSVCQMCYTTT